MNFSIKYKDKQTKARCGKITVSGKEINTPVFMPVATQATVKALSSQELSDCGVEMIISNAYHLYLRPGKDIVEKAGRLT